MTPFTFNAVSAGSNSAAVGATSGGVTPWYRISERTAPSSFILSGTFDADIQLEYSNSPDFDKGTDYVQDANKIVAATLRELPLGIGDYVRLRCTRYVSGAPKASFARPLGPGIVPFAVAEDSKKTPAPSSAGA